MKQRKLLFNGIETKYELNLIRIQIVFKDMSAKVENHVEEILHIMGKDKVADILSLRRRVLLMKQSDSYL
jgi:hypothetical protein